MAHWSKFRARPSPTAKRCQLVCFVSSIESWRIHGEILSLSIAYPDRTLTPILIATSPSGRAARARFIDYEVEPFKTTIGS